MTSSHDASAESKDREVWEMLNALKKEVLSEIAAAALEGQSPRVVAAADRLRHVEGLLERQRALLVEAQSLVSPSGGVRSESSRSDTPPQLRVLGDSPRAIGDRRRAEFVKHLTSIGKRLVQHRGATFLNQAGETVGIAYASERVRNGWFLGLTEGSFAKAVLLCEPAAGRMFAVCLPRTFFDEYGKRLSTSQNQVKFNVKKRGSRYYVPVPRLGPIDVTQYIDNYGMVA